MNREEKSLDPIPLFGAAELLKIHFSSLAFSGKRSTLIYQKRARMKRALF
ncbi:MAG: hypothetical protein IKJ23_07530 [Bacteroidaceae bacterium]|nr:hypothetical protein [Bacteroidaceae bacterium]